MSDNLIPVLETKDLLELVLVRQLLEEAGIAVMQTGTEDTISQVPGAFMLNQVGYRLFVNAQDADRARRLIEDYRKSADAGEYQIDDEGE